ncbi:MAG: GTP-binding protein [Syntrophobacteraceae bacterium]|jgi:G3E family GTPase
MIVDIVFGFLGSGKTTFIARVLQEWGGKEKIVVLVNEFGEVGVDGTLLKERGGNVVEMPSGCICCTLQSDFRTQLLDIMQSIQPQRVIIEPTGVATIAQIRSIIEAQLFEKAISRIHYVLISDATGFMGLYKANPHFVESQVKNARVVLLNKCDRVDKRKAMLTRDAIAAINPDATVISTEFGAVDWSQYQLALSTPQGSKTLQTERGFVSDHRQDGWIGDQRVIHLHDEDDALGYESFGLVYSDLTFDEKDLSNFFEKLNASEMGEVVRAKGIFRVENKSILMELASGEFSSQPVRPAEQSKVSIIGRKLNRKEIGGVLERCVTRRVEE